MAIFSSEKQHTMLVGLRLTVLAAAAGELILAAGQRAVGAATAPAQTREHAAVPISLGPVGPGPWNDPAAGAVAQGIAAETVANVSASYEALPTAFCLSVVKNGYLVVDQQYGYGTRCVLPPAGQTRTALGAAVLCAARTRVCGCRTG